eukprot:328662-Hanusia_phi.AAC.1
MAASGRRLSVQPGLRVLPGCTTESPQPGSGVGLTVRSGSRLSRAAAGGPYRRPNARVRSVTVSDSRKPSTGPAPPSVEFPKFARSVGSGYRISSEALSRTTRYRTGRAGAATIRSWH